MHYDKSSNNFLHVLRKIEWLTNFDASSCVYVLFLNVYPVTHELCQRTDCKEWYKFVLKIT